MKVILTILLIILQANISATKIKDFSFRLGFGLDYLRSERSMGNDQSTSTRSYKYQWVSSYLQPNINVSGEMDKFSYAASLGVPLGLENNLLLKDNISNFTEIGTARNNLSLLAEIRLGYILLLNDDSALILGGRIAFSTYNSITTRFSGVNISEANNEKMVVFRPLAMISYRQQIAPLVLQLTAAIGPLTLMSNEIRNVVITGSNNSTIGLDAMAEAKVFYPVSREFSLTSTASFEGVLGAKSQIETSYFNDDIFVNFGELKLGVGVEITPTL